jgi:hypothetical protein
MSMLKGAARPNATAIVLRGPSLFETREESS